MCKGQMTREREEHFKSKEAPCIVKVLGPTIMRLNQEPFKNMYLIESRNWNAMKGV